MAALGAGTAARPPRQHRHVAIPPTRYRAFAQRWPAGAALTLVLLVSGVLTGTSLLVLLAVAAGLVTARRGWRLRRALRRLDDVGLTRWSANVAMMLLPTDGTGRGRGIAQVRAPDGVERTPEALLRHVLGDERRTPTVAPWVTAGDDEAPTGSSGAARRYRWVPASVALAAAATAFVVWSADASDEVLTASIALSLVPVVASVVLVAGYRVEVHEDGRLRVRRGLRWHELRLARLLQVSGWTWSVDSRGPGDLRPRLRAVTTSLVFGDGSHDVVHPRRVEDDELVGRALRWWVRRANAVVTPDMAYALDLSDDPREPSRAVRVVETDRWMRRPGRRLRTAAVHLATTTCVLHPPLLGFCALVLSR